MRTLVGTHTIRMIRIGEMAHSNRRLVPSGAGAAFACRSAWVPRNSRSPDTTMNAPRGTEKSAPPESGGYGSLS